MHSIRPYIVVPTLIEQPTWGGEYIGQLKKLAWPELVDAKIGQSYELFAGSNLSNKLSTSHEPTVALADPGDPEKEQIFSGDDTYLTIQSLIDSEPEKVLGKAALSKSGAKMDTLIKLTQARGNSYQLHARKEEVGHKWLPKPESWYYFKPGLATIGVKKNVDWDEYHNTCQVIYAQSRNLSARAMAGEITVEEARTKLASVIAENDPMKFVNLVQVGTNQAIDLSKGGIHHSWEQDLKKNPEGNVLYEVQKNVYDPVSTIRCFDEGKIKDDGSVRELHIEDYFEQIDKDPKANDPKSHIGKGKVLKQSSRQTVRQIFDNQHYQLRELSFQSGMSNGFTTTTDSFHHVFVRSGSVKLLWDKGELMLTAGFSGFVPACIGKYELKTYKCKMAKVLVTYV